MIYTIRQGKHSAKPVSWGLWKDKAILEREVVFNESCKYDTPDVYDSEDINKLFGIGFFPKGPIDAFIGRWITGKYTDEDFHHKDSARFGWVYDQDKNNIILYSYCYIDGQRVSKEMLHVPLFVPVKCTITITKSYYQFTTKAPGITFTSQPIAFGHTKHWSFLLDLYFGGNLVAPHDIEITMTK